MNLFGSKPYDSNTLKRSWYKFNGVASPGVKIIGGTNYYSTLGIQ